MKIIILIDDANSWFIKYARILKELLSIDNQVTICHNIKDCLVSDVCFMLSCTKIVPTWFLKQNKHNIVVHASALPKGKGFTPLKWQILEGKNIIPLTLFEAIEELDAGDIYMKDAICFEGHELLDEMQEKMALKIIRMCFEYANNVDNYIPTKQDGISSFYRKFNKYDDYINVDKTIREIFLRIRVADFKNYPLKFKINGYEYSLNVTKIKNDK